MMQKTKSLRAPYNLTLLPEVQRAGARLAQQNDMSLSRLIERLLAREARKAGLLEKGVAR